MNINYMQNYVKKNNEEITQSYNFINKTIHMYIYIYGLLIQLYTTLKIMLTYMYMYIKSRNTISQTHNFQYTIRLKHFLSYHNEACHRRTAIVIKNVQIIELNETESNYEFFMKVKHSAWILPSTKTSSNFLAKFMPRGVNTC